MYTGEELKKALEGGTLRPEISLIGYVRDSSTNQAIQFSLFDCENWIDIPLEYIAKAEILSHEMCNGTSFPIVRLEMQEPTSDAGAKALFSLLQMRNRANLPSREVARHSALSRVIFSRALSGPIIVSPGDPRDPRPAPRDEPEDCELLYAACIAAGYSRRYCDMERWQCRLSSGGL